jgi:hypothetical protein
VESLILKVYTLDGKDYSVRIYIQGPPENLYKRLPKEIAEGVWASETTFIPASAIARVEIAVGARAQFPSPPTPP